MDGGLIVGKGDLASPHLQPGENESAGEAGANIDKDTLASAGPSVSLSLQ